MTDDYMEGEFLDEAVSSDVVTDLNALNVQIDSWLDERKDQAWDENAFHDFCEQLLRGGGLDTTRDRLIHGVVTQWPDIGLKKQSLQKAWKFSEDQIHGQVTGSANENEVERLAELGITDPGQWPEQVDGQQLAQDIDGTLRTFITAAEPSYALMTLWVLHTHCIQHESWLDCSPRLVFKSPKPGCGKSTAMSVLRSMCPRSLMSSSLTGASMFRIISEIGPSLFVDEIDSSGVLADIGHLAKSGYKRGEAIVMRCAGSDSSDIKVEGFNVFGPLALAGIGNRLDAALASRCFEVTLHGRTAAEARNSRRFKGRDQRNLKETLLAKAARWSVDNEGALAAVGDMPDHGIANRDHDLAETLWTIAQVLGGNWPDALKASLLALSESKEDPRQRREDILLDVIRLAHAEAEYRTGQGDPTEWTDLKFTASELWRGMTTIDEGKWNEGGPGGSKGLTVHVMERALSPFAPPGVKSLARLADNPHILSCIEKARAPPGGTRGARNGGVRRNRKRAIHISDLRYAYDRYIKPDDVTDI